MKVELTKAEMLALWKRRHFLEPLRADCRISRSDGVDVDERCAEDMRVWYLSLLRCGPRHLLAPVNVARQCQAVTSPEGYVEVVLPAGTVRVLTVRMAGWEREAEVRTDDAGVEAALQANPFSRGGVARPVAVHHPGSEVMRLYSPAIRTGCPLDVVEAVIDFGPEQYVMDEEAVAEI